MTISIKDVRTHVFLIICLMFLSEALFYGAFRFGWVKEGVFRGIKTTSHDEFNSYLDERDADLGWPTTVAFAANHDAAGYRNSPAVEKSETDALPCLAVYGGSQTFASEVSDEEAWPDQLSRQMGCKVLNFGVAGYGTDQALIRFAKLHPNGVPALMVFGRAHLSRNRTQFPGLWTGLINIRASKPRFLLVNDSSTGQATLRKIDLPINEFEDLALLQEPSTVGNVVPDDYQLPDQTVWGPISPSFPYSLTASKLYWNKLMRRVSLYSDIDDDTGFSYPLKEFLVKLAPINPLFEKETILLQTLLLERFVQMCNKKKISCKILKIPSVTDLIFFEARKPRLLDEIKRYQPITKSILEVDLGCINRKFIKRSNPPDKIEDHRTPQGHYSGLLNSLFAECLHKALVPLVG